MRLQECILNLSLVFYFSLLVFLFLNLRFYIHSYIHILFTFRLLLTWLASFSLSLSLFSHFSFYSSSWPYPISPSTFYFTPLSLLPRFLLLLRFSSVVTAFLSTFSYLAHFVHQTLQTSLYLHVLDLPALFRLLKVHLLPSTLRLSLSHIIFSSTRPLIFVSISFLSSPTSFVFLIFSLFSFIFSLFLHHLRDALFSFSRSQSPSISACSNMATRCPITRLVSATVFPLYIRRRPRRRKDPHQPSRDTPFYFPVFSTAQCGRSFILIHQPRILPAW